MGPDWADSVKRFWLAGLAVAMVAGAAQAQPVVVVDTGHSARSPGARSAYDRPEYGFNAQLVHYLVPALQAKGVTVRLSNVQGTLAVRTQGTDQAHLFVSIHHDSIPQAWIDQGRRKEFSGFSVFVSQKNSDQAKSLMCARTVGRGLLQAGETPSKYHATPMAGENRPLLDPAHGVHRYDDLIVLKSARSPALLVEAGVIANPDEDRRLGEPATAKRLAQAIADGVASCLFAP